jgi:hypothetical protein
MKTRTAFYLCTTPLTRISRRLCRHLIQPRHAARAPFWPINIPSVKQECKDTDISADGCHLTTGLCSRVFGHKLNTHKMSSISMVSIEIGSWAKQISQNSGFGGLVVSMLASGTQVRGFKPWPKPSDFSGEKILSMSSFGGEVKPSVPCLSFAACKRTLQLPCKSQL